MHTFRIPSLPRSSRTPFWGASGTIMMSLLASSPGGEWQFPKMIRTILWPRAATEKSAKDQPRRGSVRFFPWSKFGPFQVYCIFGNRHASWRRRFAIYKRLRANSRDIDSTLSTRASSPINSLAFCSIMQPGVGRGFRLLGADLGCPICVCSTAPSEAAVLPPSWRQDPGLGGGPCIMQDTPNSYLEVERRDPLPGICKGVAWAGERIRGRDLYVF